ncbi:hypothetical protein SOVF_068440 [Spinacia oleracea]|nr:hypothetical protein SOVF_068440 [Spinacia oleracea]
MAWRTGSASRFLNATRSPSIRPSTAVRRPPSPLLPNSRRLSFTNPRSLEVLGCVQSLMPMYNVVVAAVTDARLTSRIEFDPRACCQLSKGS